MSPLLGFLPGIGVRISPNRPIVSKRVSKRVSRATVRSCQPPLSARAQTLIREQQANPLFDVNKAPAELSGILGRAQEEGAFVEASQLPAPGGAKALAADAIRLHAAAGIEMARETIMREYPGIDKPGGALHPEHRARACWRDLNEFARVVSYGVAAGGDVLSDKGVEVMKLIYEELEVPIDPMAMGIAVLGQEIAESMGEESEVRIEISKGFAHLLEVFGGF